MVTGAARGIGRASASAIAERGARVIMLDRDIDTARQTAEWIGQSARALECDVSDEDSVTEAFAAVFAEHNRVDVLHNNAGIFLEEGANGGVEPFETDLDTWNRTLAVNLTGAFLCTKQVVPAMVSAGAGSIVMTASASGALIGSPSLAYATSKAALVGLTRALVIRYAHTGIRVNAVCPGTIDTDLTKTVRRSEALRARFVDTIPLGRIGTADEVGQLVAFLASPASAYLNGAIIPVDGGRIVD